MRDLEENSQKRNIKQEPKILAKNTFFTYITKYGNLIFSLIMAFIMARIINKEDWGIFIMANSIILIIVTISAYFPPAIDYTLNYYLSRFSILEQEGKIKPFIKKALLSKLTFLIPLYILSIFIFTLFSKIFQNYLGNNLMILLILSPNIIILGLNPLLYGINVGLNKYKIVSLTSLLPLCIQIITLSLSLFFLSNISLELIAIVNVIAYLAPFIFTSIITFRHIKESYFYNKPTSEFKNFYKKSINYGLPISFGYLIYGFWDQIQIQGVALLNNPTLVTGYHISLTFSNYSTLVLSSLAYPLITSFSRLDSAEKNNKIKSVYNLVVKFSLFILLIVSGSLYFLTDFILITIYGESYLVFSDMVKLMIIAVIFKIVITPFEALVFARNQVKIIPYLRLTMLLIYFSLFFPFLFLYGINGALYGIIISNVIILILYIILTFKYEKIILDISSIIKQYFSLILALVITVLLENLIFHDLNFKFFQAINLSPLKFFPILSILSFLLIIFLSNSIFRTISRSEIETIESFFNKENKLDNVILRGLKILKKIFRK